MRRRLDSLAVAVLVAVLTAGLAGACSVEVSDELRDVLDNLADARDAAAGDVEPDATASVDVGGPVGDTAACPEGAPCDDDDPCTTADRCVRGFCVGGFPPDCDDGDACTSDSCVPDRGCVHARRDDDPACRPPLPCDTPCDDVNPCTVDTCDEAIGACVHDPIPTCRPCDLGDSGPIDCDDGDPGTEDDCVWSEALAGAVCSWRPVPCGLTDADCDDGDPCTTDTVGRDCLCAHEPTDVPCDGAGR